MIANTLNVYKMFRNRKIENYNISICWWPTRIRRLPGCQWPWLRVRVRVTQAGSRLRLRVGVQVAWLGSSFNLLQGFFLLELSCGILKLASEIRKEPQSDSESGGSEFNSESGRWLTGCRTRTSESPARTQAGPVAGAARRPMGNGGNLKSSCRLTHPSYPALEGIFF
jgi:hypothetical protein